MIDTTLLEEQITRMEQIIEQRAKQITLLKAQQKEEIRMAKDLRKGFENLEKLKKYQP